MPTKHTMLLCSWRAAAMVMISSAVYPRSRTALLLRCGFQARLELGEIPGSHHMPGHPGEKRLALAGDIVPRLVEYIIALVIALGIRGPGAMGFHADGAQGE